MQGGGAQVSKHFDGYFSSHGGPQILAPSFNTNGGSIHVGANSSTTEEDKCLQCLWPTGIDYESQKDQNPKRVPGTCGWTLTSPKYVDWRDSHSKKLLWISADPGCGKSVLAKCIIDEDLPQNLPNTSSTQILYYFFKDTSPEQRSATRAVSSILHQLLAARPQLIQYAIPSHREIGSAFSQIFPKLWSTFSAAVADPSAGDVICVLDALDECNEQEQPRLIEYIEQILTSTSRLKFLITSRPYFDIRSNFYELLKASTNIELAGNDESASIKQEIDLVIKHRVKVLAHKRRLVPKVQAHLEERLLEMEHRTYLWLRLIWELVHKSLSGTISTMNKLIDNLPVGIQESYEALLQRCDDPSFTKRALQIVLVAGRPLTLEEMDVALHMDEQTLSCNDLELEGSSRLQETLPSRCGLMISIVQSKVYFIHQTVKDFLVNNEGKGSPSGKIWQQSLTLQISHHLMTDICLRSITFPEIQLDQADLGNALLPLDLRNMESSAYCQSYGLLAYAAIYWADHYQHTNKGGAIKIIERFLTAIGDRSVIGRHKMDWGTTLHAASVGGHDKVVQMLLEKGAEVNAQGGYCGNALQAASRAGHEKVVQILLDAGADVNAQGGQYGNALQAASRAGHEKVVQTLLDAGADVNAQGGLYGNALEAVSECGHEKVVQILLDAGADVNAQGGHYGNALQAASRAGQEKVVQILLDAGADVNAQGGHYGNALQAASIAGQEKVVQILLDAGADVNAQGGLYGNALQAASIAGQEKVVQILLDAGADVNAQGGLYGNALEAVSECGHEKVVQILLDAGADVNAQGGHYGNALQAASRAGHEKVVQILLDAGADVNAQGGQYGNALQAASRAGHEKVVQTLLDAGADVNAQGGYHSKNALQVASERGHEKVVQILLDAGAGVKVEEGRHGN